MSSDAVFAPMLSPISLRLRIRPRSDNDAADIAELGLTQSAVDSP
jgi:hypothetical protein